MKIYIATDHAGFKLKEVLVAWLSKEGHEVIDVGADTYDKDDDYPIYVTKAAVQVARNSEARGLVLGASGQGEAMVANRIKGVRAAVFYGEPKGLQRDASGQTQSIITGSREHNDANVLALGARFLTAEEAVRAVDLWLKTKFSGAKRHKRRITMIDKLLP